MKNYICITCGMQYLSSDQPPSVCKICDDERQYVGWDGQQWTTLEEMWQSDFHNVIKPIEPNMFGIDTKPSFGIGHRSLLIKTEHGNVLWDPVSYLDSQTIQEVHAFGGIKAISVSHPHFYSSIIEWSHAFGHAPIYLPEVDKEWIMRPSGAISFFKDRIEIFPGISVIRCGGHFPGSSVLHWEDGADGKGTLLAGDTIMVGMDRKSTSFMYSFPNQIPLSADIVSKIVDRVRALTFDRLYSAWSDRQIVKNAKKIVSSSADRYIQAITK